MGTSMKEITARLCRKKVKEFIPIGEYLRASGHFTDSEIWKIFRKYVHHGMTGNYKETLNYNIEGVIKSILADEPGDLPREAYFMDKLAQSVVEYYVNYQVGEYRVQYLIDGWLIVEIDTLKNKKRDQYFKEMGYKLLNIPGWLLEISIDAVINEIKELTGKG